MVDVKGAVGRPGRPRGARAILVRLMLAVAALSCWLGSARAVGCSVTIARIAPSNTTAYVSLAEVELLTSLSPLTKIPASSLNATLSSTFIDPNRVRGPTFYNPLKCFDGVVSNDDSSVCVTAATDKAPKLTIVYPCSQQLVAVRVHNRRDFRPDYINSLQMTVQDATGACLTTRFRSLGSALPNYTIPVTAVTRDVPASPPICFVKIEPARLTGLPGGFLLFLNLAEVELLTSVSPLAKIPRSSLSFGLSTTFVRPNRSYVAAKCFDGVVSTNDSSVCATTGCRTSSSGILSLSPSECLAVPTLTIAYPCTARLAAVRVSNRRDYGTNFIDYFSIAVQDASGVRQTTRFLAQGSAQQVYTIPVAQTACPWACDGVVCGNATACLEAEVCAVNGSAPGGFTCAVGAPKPLGTNCTTSRNSSGVCLAGRCEELPGPSPCLPNPCGDATECRDAPDCAYNSSAPGLYTCSAGVARNENATCTGGGPQIIGVCRSGECVDPCASVSCNLTAAECRDAHTGCFLGTCIGGQPKPNGTLCSYGTCQGGSCVNATVGLLTGCVGCNQTESECMYADVCILGLVCNRQPKPNGTLCNYGTCQGGSCVNTTGPPPVCAGCNRTGSECMDADVCLATDLCAFGGPKANGTFCRINGTVTGTCQGGSCVNTTATIVCNPACSLGSNCMYPQSCDTSGTCVGGGPKSNGTMCYNGASPGTCQGGSCTSIPSGPTGLPGR